MTIICRVSIPRGFVTGVFFYYRDVMCQCRQHQWSSAYYIARHIYSYVTYIPDFQGRARSWPSMGIESLCFSAGMPWFNQRAVLQLGSRWI